MHFDLKSIYVAIFMCYLSNKLLKPFSKARRYTVTDSSDSIKDRSMETSALVFAFLRLFYNLSIERQCCPSAARTCSGGRRVSESHSTRTGATYTANTDS